MGSFSARLEQDMQSDPGLRVEPKFGTVYSTYRAVQIVTRNIFKEIVWTVILLGIGVVVPFLSVVTVPLIFIVQAYYAGFGNIDVCIGRHLDVRQSIDYIKRNRLMTVTNGAIFLGILLIPIIGAFLAPMLATASATISVAKDMD